MPKPLIALDADGVLLDFHLAYAGYTHTKYARLWAKTRGTRAK